MARDLISKVGTTWNKNFPLQRKNMSKNLEIYVYASTEDRNQTAQCRFFFSRDFLMKMKPNGYIQIETESLNNGATWASLHILDGNTAWFDSGDHAAWYLDVEVYEVD